MKDEADEPPLLPLRLVMEGVERIVCCHKAVLSGRYHPNSLEAVVECVRAGAPRVEVDVHFLRDDSLLVFHDRDLERETTGYGPVESLDARSAARVRYADGVTPLAFFHDVVAVIREGNTALHVDVKLHEPLTPSRAHRLASFVLPLGERAVVGSRSYWNLRHLQALGVRVALDPSNEWNAWPPEVQVPALSGRVNRHGLRDDSAIGDDASLTPEAYVRSRIAELSRLLPGAVEWMMDVSTILKLEMLCPGFAREIEARGAALTAWGIRDEGPAETVQTVHALCAAGARFLIPQTDPGFVRYLAFEATPLA